MADAIKMAVELTDENADSERGIERLIISPKGNGTYILESIPWFARNLDRGDIVEASQDAAGEYHFVGIVKRGGHTTYHMRIDAANADPDLPLIVEELLEEIHGIGALIENNGAGIVSIDVPPTIDGSLVLGVLVDAQNDGVIDFEGSDTSAPEV